MIHRIDRFEEGPINPVTTQAYDENWIVLCITNDPRFQAVCGSKNGCAYTLRISCIADGHWKMNMGDFLDFHLKQGKQILLVSTEKELKTMQIAYEGHTHNDAFLRDYEPCVVVHSSPSENWNLIQKDGCLKSWSLLKREDGQHLKVRESMPLEPYLLWACDWKNAGLQSEISTPHLFREAANKHFNELFSKRGFSV